MAGERSRGEGEGVITAIGIITLMISNIMGVIVVIRQDKRIANLKASHVNEIARVRQDALQEGRGKGWHAAIAWRDHLEALPENYGKAPE